MARPEVPRRLSPWGAQALLILLAALAFGVPYLAVDLYEAFRDREWRRSGLSPYEIEEWRREGVTDVRERNGLFKAPGARLWRVEGFKPEEAAEWNARGFAPREALRWRKDGFTASRAGPWRDAGFLSQDARRIADAGISPEAAASRRKRREMLP